MSDSIDDNSPGKRKRGRPPDGIGPKHLKLHLQHVQELCPGQVPGTSFKSISMAMETKRLSAPSWKTLQEQVSEGAPLTIRTINALHAVYGLADLGLEASIWLKSESEFRAALIEVLYRDPLKVFQGLADWNYLVEIKTRSQTLGIGTPQPPRLAIGGYACLDVTLPFPARVTVANVDRKDGAQLWYGLNRDFGTGGQVFQTGRLILPSHGKGVPVSGPVGGSTLVVVIVAEAQILEPLPEAGANGLDHDLVRRFGRAAKALPAATRRVAVIDYEVYPCSTEEPA